MISHIFISNNKENKLSRSQITPFVLCLKDNPIFLLLPPFFFFFIYFAWAPSNVDLANFNWGCEYEILTFHHLWHYNPKILNWNMTSSLVQPLTLWDFNESFHSSTTTLDINNSNQIKCFILKDLEVRTFKRKVVNLMAYKLKNCNSHIMSTFFFLLEFLCHPNDWSEKHQNILCKLQILPQHLIFYNWINCLIFKKAYNSYSLMKIWDIMHLLWKGFKGWSHGRRRWV